MQSALHSASPLTIRHLKMAQLLFVTATQWSKSVLLSTNCRNFSQCDSLLLRNNCGAHTWPYVECGNDSSILEHEATTSKISEDQLFYCNQRGIDTEKAIGLIVNGYAKDVLNKLPMEFAVEAQKLLSITLEGSVG